MNDLGGLPGSEEAPTAAANLVIVLVRVGYWQPDGSSPEPISIISAEPLPTEQRVLREVDPEFATRYQAEFPALVRFLITCGANHQDANDAAQEAFEELFNQWKNVRHPRQWLRVVAYRIFLRRPVGNTSPLEMAQEIASSLSASARFDFREEEGLVLDILDLLPTTQRAVLALFYDQFKIRDIAEIMGMKDSAVRKNLQRARTTLMKLVDFSGEHPRLRREPPAEEAGR